MTKVNVNTHKLYSAPEVAQLLGISNVAVFKKIKEHKIMANKVGGVYVIKGEDLAEYINPSKEFTEKKKQLIEDIVKKVVKEYGVALRKLGKE